MAKNHIFGGLHEKKGWRLYALAGWGILELGCKVWTTVVAFPPMLPSFWLFHRSKYGPFKEMATLFFEKFKIPAACWRRPGAAISKTGLVLSVTPKTTRELAHEQTYRHTYILDSFIIID